MKVIRTICPHCKKEISRKVFDKKNLKEYLEKMLFKTCENCANSPEVKLLDAIFGRRK